MVASEPAMKAQSGLEVGLAEAQAAVRDAVRVLSTEQLDLKDAVGRVLRQDAVCSGDLPPADVSAMDGFCVASSATRGASGSQPVVLKVAGTLRAGVLAGAGLDVNQCMAIVTGAALPLGADAVVRMEDAKERDGFIEIRSPVPPGSHVRRRGEFVAAGTVVRLAGRSATPQVMGLLAALGVERVAVTRKPRLAVVGTGDELARPGTAPEGAQIRSSNPLMLGAIGLSLGCEVVWTGMSPDDPDRIAAALEECRACDAVIVSGGVGGGRFDLVGEALELVGAKVVFSNLRMRSGKRTIFATRGDKVFFCLSGSPTAAFAAFHTIVRPGLLAMLGLGAEDRLVPARASETIAKQKGYAKVVPARLVRDTSRGWLAEPVSAGGPGDVVGLGEVSCLVLLGEEAGPVAAGEPVDVLMV
jgi:molybdopterin molybdotransferase